MIACEIRQGSRRDWRTWLSVNAVVESELVGSLLLFHQSVIEALSRCDLSPRSPTIISDEPYSNTMTTGKPQSSEAAPYYFTYIDLVGDDDVVRVLHRQLDEMAAWCATISEERSLYRYAEGKWSIRGVLSHINDAERLFAFRAFWFARGLQLDLPSFDQNVAAANAQADRVSWAAHVEEFRRVRLASISLYGNLAEEAWALGGVASGNYFSVRALAFLTAGHLTHHLGLLASKYQPGR